MRYRIIKKYNDAGKKYYIAQFLHNNEWKYIESEPICVFPICEKGYIRHFDTHRAAKKALREKARQLKKASISKVVAEGVM